MPADFCFTVRAQRLPHAFMHTCTHAGASSALGCSAAFAAFSLLECCWCRYDGSFLLAQVHCRGLSGAGCVFCGVGCSVAPVATLGR
jgi:hypothetical protein